LAKRFQYYQNQIILIANISLNNNYKVNSTCWAGDLDLLFWEETWAYWNGTLNDKYIFEGFIVDNGIIKFAYNLTGGENDWQYIDEFDNLLVANLLNDNDASENENSLRPICFI
jgi:hypothetical protein